MIEVMSETQQVIFLVDDDVTGLKIGRDFLSNHYRVYTCKSAALMFTLLERVIPDLILLDIEMEGMDGFAALEKLKCDEKTSSIPVMMLTGHMKDEVELKGFSLGAADFVTKPYSTARLLKRIEVQLLAESQKKRIIDYNKNLQEIVKEKTLAVYELKNVILQTMSELIEHRDAITGSHIDRTQKGIRIMLKAMKEQDVYQEDLAQYDETLVVQSSALHDIGKIAVDDSILRKPGQLTYEEREAVKIHSEFGEKIIRQIMSKTTDNSFLEYAAIFAVSHHEKWDGTGYPYGLSGEEIPIIGRIMAIIDVYDALISDRPYKKGFTHEEAITIIEKSKGQHFDPVLTDLFMSISGEIRNEIFMPLQTLRIDAVVAELDERL